MVEIFTYLASSHKIFYILTDLKALHNSIIIESFHLLLNCGQLRDRTQQWFNSTDEHCQPFRIVGRCKYLIHLKTIGCFETE